MIITLPQVNKVNPWKPIKKSVIAKLNSKAGKYLIPSKAGTQKLNANKLVKFGG